MCSAHLILCFTGLLILDEARGGAVGWDNKMQRYTVYLYLETALHVSGGTSTHHQERIQLYLQYLVFVILLLLSAAIVEELEPVWHSNRLCKQKSSSRPLTTEDDVERVRASVLHSGAHIEHL
jgi:hypothetical protein